MGEKLTLLLHLALNDKKIKDALVKTKNATDPVSAFCKKAKEYGIEISEAELFLSGEEFTGSMLRSVNGGGVEAFDSWTDFYELFFAAL
ncbi:MAG: hypothetical protein IJC89_01060 [Clostridia bacterium]|nr:hypothetical protein [Clostridia bacterium]